jgi:dTDP-4-amino-4,6-dideoxygalactose transaminase
MEAIARAAPGIPIIEDAACAAGAAYRERPAGSLGHAAAFSFHPRKSVTTGEGGMITTNDSALAKRVDMLRNHGASLSEEQRHQGTRPYLLPEFNLLGYNYRMTDLQGAVGVVQLAKLDRFLAERQRWADYYANELGGIDWLRLPRTPEGSRHGWQSYVCYVDEARAPAARNALMERLNAAGVSARPGTHAVPGLAYYRRHHGTDPDAFPRARDCERYTMAIPLHNRMSAEDYRHVVSSIQRL